MPVELAAQQRTLVETNERDTKERYRKFAIPDLLGERIRIRVKYAKVSHTRPCCQLVELKFHSILSTTITFQRHFSNIYQHNLARNPPFSTYSPLPSLFSLASHSEIDSLERKAKSYVSNGRAPRYPEKRISLFFLRGPVTGAESISYSDESELSL